MRRRGFITALAGLAGGALVPRPVRAALEGVDPKLGIFALTTGEAMNAAEFVTITGVGASSFTAIGIGRESPYPWEPGAGGIADPAAFNGADRIALDEVSARRFARRLAAPPTPNARLRAAMQRHAVEVESR